MTNPRGENDVDTAVDREARPAEILREQCRPEDSRDSRRDGIEWPCQHCTTASMCRLEGVCAHAANARWRKENGL